MQRGDAASQGAGKAGILRPHRMFRPHFRARWAGGLIAVGQRIYAGAGIIAKVGMDIDDTGGDIFAGGVDHPRAGRNRHAGANFGHLAIFQPDHAGGKFVAGTIINGGAGDHGGDTRIGLVMAGPGIGGNCHHLRRGGRFGSSGCRRRRIAGAACQHGGNPQWYCPDL